MPKFKIKNIHDSLIYLNENDIFHITKSLRKKIGDVVYCYDEEYEYEGKIKSISEFSIIIISKNEIINNIKNINVYLGLINKNNFELAIQKLNEINCKSITPVLFSRSQYNIKLNEERINRIIFESSKQCNRNTNIIVNKEISFDNLIKLIQKNKTNILAYQFSDMKENNIDYEILNELDIINLIIGPEGGFTNDEINLLKDICYKIKLTDTILKSETAAISLASIVIYEMSKYNEKK